MSFRIRSRNLSSALVVLGAAVCLALSAAGAAWSTPEDVDRSKVSRSTRQLLREHGLKRTASSDPAAAIRSLDGLQAEGAIPPAETAFAIAEIALAASADQPTPRDVGFLLDAASAVHPLALEEIEQAAAPNSTDHPAPAVDLYRDAVAGLVEALQMASTPVPGGPPHPVEGPLHSYELSWVPGADAWGPGSHSLIPASRLRTTRKQRLGRRPGAGVPVVAVPIAEPPDPIDTFDHVFPVYRDYYPLTLLLELTDAGPGEPRQARLRLIDPRIQDSVRLDQRTLPLALDMGAQLAAMAPEVDVTFGKKGAARAGRYLSSAGLYLLEPLRAEKIPVVMIHGLSASPQTWGAAFDAFTLDPEIRQAYQFSFFAYPTGLPFPFSALILRRTLMRVRDQLKSLGSDRRDPRVVLLGHSMGGLLSRMQVTDSGTELWDASFAVPPEDLELEQEDVELLEEMLIIEPLPFVERVVFCSTPHRGSKYAANALGKLGASLVKIPGDLVQLGQRVALAGLDMMTTAAAERGKMPDAVQSLQPDFPILPALDRLGIAPGVPYHSLIGDRGKGNSPDSSDGVVAYWSSHLEGAASERIVPSGHSSHQHPEGVEELRRILHLHLAEAEPRGKLGTAGVRFSNDAVRSDEAESPAN